MILRGAVSAALLSVLAIGVAVPAQAYTPPVTTTVFPLPTERSAGPLAAGLDGNLWISRGSGFGEQPATFPVTVINPQGGVVKQAPDGGAETLGPDGNFWFTRGPKVGRMTPAGVVTLFRMPSTTAQPEDITPGPDGNLWFYSHETVFRITPAGQITQMAQLANVIGGIAAGADGNVWVTEFHHTALVARITPAGVVTEFPFPRADSEPHGIAPGPDGNIWVAERHRNAIARVTPGGAITEFLVPRAKAGPLEIVTGSDGNLWFSEAPTLCCTVSTMIGRITPSGAITEFAQPSQFEFQSPRGGPVAGPDGNAWLTFGGTQTGYAARVRFADRGARHVLSRDAGFSPGSVSIAYGGYVQWTFYGPAVHEVADTSGFGLFDSGPQSIVSPFRARFTTAGVYSYADPLHPGETGKITVAPTIFRSLGGGTTTYSVGWAFAPATGSRVFDVQVRRPGAAGYENWKIGTTDQDAFFANDPPSGSYSFRVRMRDTATGVKSGYASRSITVP